METGNMVFRPTVLAGTADNADKAVTEESYLCGLIVQISEKLHIDYPNAFIYATGTQSNKTTEKYEKIQNRAYFKAFAPICKEIWCEQSDCKQSDSLAAEYLLEYSGKPLTEYNILENIKPEKSESNPDIIGISYKCKYSGYIEIAFPIRLYDRKLGVFIVGQVLTRKNRDSFEKIVRAEYDKQHRSQEDIDVILRMAKEETDFQGLIDKIVKAVEYIEASLVERYIKRQNAYCVEKGKELIVKFNNKLVESGINMSKVISAAFPAVENARYYRAIGETIRSCLADFCESVGIKAYNIFVPDEENLYKDNYNELSSGGEVFAFDKYTLEYPKNDYLCEGAEKYVYGTNYEYNYVFISPTRTYPITIALNKNDFLPVNASVAERGLLKENLRDIFKSFTDYVKMVGLEAKSDYFKVFLDSSMGIMRHEIGQSNAGYLLLIEEFKNDIEIASEQLDNSVAANRFLKKCSLFAEDSEKYHNITATRMRSTKYLLEFKMSNPQWFYPYEAFLFKWQQIFFNKAYKKGIYLDFPDVTIMDNTRPQMYGDAEMIEQAAYNLTNNAIKYAMVGSKISVDCYVDKAIKRYIFKVTNIAHPLKNNSDTDRLFEFGVRGDNNTSSGSGIGLFLTRQMALAHDGETECKMTVLSEYDISLIGLYIKAFEDRASKVFCADEELYKKVKQEYENKKSIIEKYMIKEPEYNEFVLMHVHNNIKKGTAEFEFRFSIPYKR